MRKTSYNIKTEALKNSYTDRKSDVYILVSRHFKQLHVCNVLTSRNVPSDRKQGIILRFRDTSLWTAKQTSVLEQITGCV